MQVKDQSFSRFGRDLSGDNQVPLGDQCSSPIAGNEVTGLGGPVFVEYGKVPGAGIQVRFVSLKKPARPRRGGGVVQPFQVFNAAFDGEAFRSRHFLQQRPDHLQASTMLDCVQGVDEAALRAGDTHQFCLPIDGFHLDALPTRSEKGGGRTAWAKADARVYRGANLGGSHEADPVARWNGNASVIFQGGNMREDRVMGQERGGQAKIDETGIGGLSLRDGEVEFPPNATDPSL